MRRLKILYVGRDGGTTLHRGNALRSLGHDVDYLPSEPPAAGLPLQLYRVAYRLRRPFDHDRANRRMLDALGTKGYDLLWIDKGNTIRPRSLRLARRLRPEISIVAYSPDDMMNPQNRSVHYLAGVADYDLHVTTKSYNVRELRELGARDVLFVDNAYDPDDHRPLKLDERDRARLGANVGFIGTYEPDRAAQLLMLAEAGIPVRVWGARWHRFRRSHPGLSIHGRELEGRDYARAICATGINLAFLRKANRDLQTTRSIEIPASGGFMLAERTDEHLRLFREGEEAEFFDGFDELLRKCRHYLDDEQGRRRIAAAGRRRCEIDGYSNADRLATVLHHLETRRGAEADRPQSS